jgi:hypothetical protein
MHRPSEESPDIERNLVGDLAVGTDQTLSGNEGR